MIFVMMRRMGGGKDTDRDIPDKNTDKRSQRLDPDQPASTPFPAGAEDRARIAHLGRENADLRAALPPHRQQPDEPAMDTLTFADTPRARVGPHPDLAGERSAIR